MVLLLRGEIPLDEDLKRLGSDIISNKVPHSWDLIWEGPDLPSEWLIKFISKVISLNKLLNLIGIDASTAKNLESFKPNLSKFYSSSLSLSDLFNPEVFLNAHRLIV